MGRYHVLLVRITKRHCLISTILDRSSSWLAKEYRQCSGLYIKKKGRLSIIVVAAFSFLLVILLFEGATEALLHRLIRPMDVAPRDGEWVPYLQMVAARGTAILAPFCFITAALIVQISGRLLAGIVFIALSFVATLQLPMDASTLAIACGAAAFLFVRWRPRLMTRFLFTGILALAFVLPLLMSSVITHDNILSVGIEPTRGQAQRLAVWEYSANLILERPVVGFGFDASRDIGSRGEIVPETNWPALPLHPHNAFLQVWLELGLIGICLLCVFLWQIWRYFEARIVENHDIAILVAAFVATLVISLISFGNLAILVDCNLGASNRRVQIVRIGARESPELFGHTPTVINALVRFGVPPGR